MNKKITPVTPGEILLEEFLIPMGISQNALARAIGVHARRINEIVLGRRGITGDTALRLGRYFGMEPEFWMNLQASYDLRMARRKLGTALEKKVRPRAAA
ncbi:MAG: HigA family addiction module antidote protein [Nitrospinae bacterium]|nr:HigA family addiction module antidote protein [Nitrospinota bacterium]